MPNTLRLMSDAAEYLQPFGETELCYLTAEFAPFSSSQRPDLLFRPHPLTHDNCFFVEFWPGLEAGEDGRFGRLLIEHRNFVVSQLDWTVRYSYATDESFSTPRLTTLAVDSPVKIFTSIESGEHLGRLVRSWAIGTA